MYRNIDYIANLVGWEHVGIGLDYCYSQQELTEFVKANKELCYPYDEIKMVSPLEVYMLRDLFVSKGYKEEVIEGIFGENFHRIASEVWLA
jgi:membrane dipeptidase